MKRPKPKTNNNRLLASLKSLSPIFKDDGYPWETNVLFQNNWAVATNHVISMGEPIQEDLLAYPKAKLMIAALNKCNETLSITQLDGKLSVKSGKFRALIPCMPIEDVMRVYPDNPIANVNDKLKTSIEHVSAITENEDSVVTASILIHDGCIVATDRKIILQSYHGISLPTLALPKAIIKPLTGNVKPLSRFGFSNSSCTFYNEDGSWIKSQFFNEQWPNVSDILDKKVNLWPLPDDFYDAVNSLEPFSEDGLVYFDTNCMRSHPSPDKGASYEVYGLPPGPVMNIKQLKLVKPFVKQVDFLVPHHNSKMMYFYGENVRGAIAGRAE